MKSLTSRLVNESVRSGNKRLAKTQGAYNPEKEAYRDLEQSYMNALDDLASIGRVLGFPQLPVWEDSSATVTDMTGRIKELQISKGFGGLETFRFTSDGVEINGRDYILAPRTTNND